MGSTGSLTAVSQNANLAESIDVTNQQSDTFGCWQMAKKARTERRASVLPAMFSSLGVTVLMVLVAVVTSFGAWIMQPLFAAREYRSNEAASEGFFWHIGPDG